MIQFIDESGMKFVVKFIHVRKGKGKEKSYTSCNITDEERLSYSTGHATCSLNDNFCRETGRKIALTRALMPFSKVARAHAWYEYFNRKQIKEYA